MRHQRYLLQRDRDRVEREHGILFAPVYNLGLKRLAVDSYPTIGQSARKAIRRKAKRAAWSMTNGLGKANDVPAEVVRAVSREQSVLGLVQFACKDSALRKQMEEEDIDAPTPLAHAAQMLMRALGVAP